MQSLLALINVSYSSSFNSQAFEWNTISTKWTLPHHLAHYINVSSYNDLFKTYGLLDNVQGLYFLLVLTPELRRIYVNSSEVKMRAWVQPLLEEAEAQKGDLACPHGRKSYRFTHSPVLMLALDSALHPLSLWAFLLSGHVPRRDTAPSAFLPSHPCSYTLQLPLLSRGILL